MDGGSDNDGVGKPYPYVQGQCTAGYFGPFKATQRFYGAHREEKSDIFLELESGECTVCSSTMGLVLCRHSHPSSFRYSVCNPFHKGSRRIIPQPDRDHPDSVPRVLVVRWDPHRLCLVFHIVCAVPADGDRSDPSYTFDVYSSNTDKWETAVKTTGTIGSSAKIRENTGVSCDATAYWLLDNPFKFVSYDVDDRRVTVGTIYVPNLWQLGYLPHLQLGRYGLRLCLVASLTKKSQIEVYTRGLGGSWQLRSWTTYEGPELPTLSRFQSCGVLQVPLWFKEVFEMVNIDLEAKSEVLIDCWKLGEVPDSYESMVPHVHSNWLPLLHFPLFP